MHVPEPATSMNEVVFCKKIHVEPEWPTSNFEWSNVESLVMEQTKRWLPLFRAVEELCNPSFATVGFAKPGTFLLLIKLKIQFNGLVFRTFENCMSLHVRLHVRS